MPRFKFILPFVGLSLFAISGHGQSQERIYLDETMHVVSDPTQAVYYQTTVRESGGEFKVRLYYNSGQLKMIGIFKDASLNERDGFFQYYYESGQLESEGYYCKNRKCGIWKRWHQSGNQKADRVYPDPENIYRQEVTETPATFPGGYAALMDFVKARTTYPEAALAKSIEGTVKISFEIDEGGLVRNVEVAESGQYFLDRAALECVWQMPLWEAAERDGSTRPSKFIMPFRFTIVNGVGKVTIGN